MMRTNICLPFLLILCAMTPAVSAQAVKPLMRAHAHNDYEHERPLLDALERGFASVEVDVHLVDGALLVAHDADDVDPARTIQSLYLDPLLDIVTRNGGAVYPDAAPFLLLIDFKTDAEDTYDVLRDVLKPYHTMLTRFEDGQVHEGAVTAVVSGNRPRETMKAERVRWAAYDGRLEDLEIDPPESTAFIPLVSSNWSQIARWYGVGDLDESARKKLAKTVRKAHDQGRAIRFWATSDNPVVWKVLFDAGVDYLNADDLKGLEAFLRERM